MEESKKEVSHFKNQIRIPLHLLTEGDKRLIFILEKKKDELIIKTRTEDKGG